MIINTKLIKMRIPQKFQIRQKTDAENKILHHAFNVRTALPLGSGL